MVLSTHRTNDFFIVYSEGNRCCENFRVQQNCCVNSFFLREIRFFYVKIVSTVQCYELSAAWPPVNWVQKRCLPWAIGLICCEKSDFFCRKKSDFWTRFFHVFFGRTYDQHTIGHLDTILTVLQTLIVLFTQFLNNFVIVSAILAWVCLWLIIWTQFSWKKKQFSAELTFWSH